MRLRDIPGLLLKAEETVNAMQGLIGRTMGKLPTKKKKSPYTSAGKRPRKKGWE